jgi:hypothetical protein
MQNGHFVTKRYELQFQFRAAAEPAGQPKEQSREECEHADDIRGHRVQSPAFSLLSEFSAGTRLRSGNL